ncbi:Uu.00g105500.m01.CDS01 [Anthostomella pinea]|uniref:Uu.00g105500.m01.CDS01 n=1 Tax=Anthostomella pinea TaxID=933095 RepID=A0AAI8VDT9_9PEZI|nr:Uu.00g105500.m01.CDS01 [Anthostomella pinea]
MSQHWRPVMTTLPLNTPGSSDNHSSIHTKRLRMRPLARSDLHAYHVLRLQPEAMAHSTYRRPDANLEESSVKLDSIIAAAQPRCFYFGIFLAETGELIGDGGVHTLSSQACGWPELGYKLKREYWGRGLCTEFLTAYLKWWWGLPRRSIDRSGGGAGVAVGVQISVHPRSIAAAGGGNGACSKAVAVEQLYAWTTLDNFASQNVLRKAGFKSFIIWKQPGYEEWVIGWRNSRPRP